MSDVIFADGLYASKPSSNAPEFIISELSLKIADFLKWLDKENELINDKGYINFTVKESKAGKYYIAVNTYKPKGESPPPPKEEYYKPEGGDEIPDDNDLPF